MLSKKNQSAAKSLAIRYRALSEALALEDFKAAKIWAGKLLESQIQTGVEIHSPEFLKSLAQV